MIRFFKRKLKENEWLGLGKTLLFHRGLWPNYEKHNNCGSTLRHFVPQFDGFVASIFLFVVFPGGAIYSWKIRDVTGACECLFLSFIASTIIVNGYCFYFQPQRFQELADKMEAMFKRRNSGSKEEQEIRHQTQSFTNLTVVVSVFFLCVLAIYIVCVIIISNVLRKLFLQGWYPYDITVSPNFELTLLALVHVTSQLSVVLVVDGFFISLLIQTIGQFRLLRHRLKHIRELAVETVDTKTKHVPESEASKRVKHKAMIDYFRIKRTGMLLYIPIREQTNYQEMKKLKRITKDVDIEMKRRIVDCVRHHVELIRFVKEIETAFSVILLNQIVVNSLGTVLVVIWFNFVKAIDVKAVGFLLVILYVTIELFIYCLFANRITDQSYKVGQAVYESDWFDASRSFKRSMMIIISMCNQPIQILVAHKIPLSAETFSNVMNMAFSYFNALKSML